MAKRKVRSIKPKPESRFSLGRIFFKVIALIFFGVIIYVIFFSGLLAITGIDVSGNENISKDDISGVIRGELSGKYLGAVPRNNLVITYLKKKKMESRILAEYKDIEVARIKFRFPDSLTALVKERKLSMGMCSRGECFFISEDGTAYKNADRARIEARNIPIMSDNSDKKIDIDKNVISSQSVEYIVRTKDKLPTVLENDPGNNFETPDIVSSDVRITLIEGWKIFFNLEIPVEKEMEMLSVVLKDKIKDQRGNLEYIDLRSDNKVFYKLKEGEVQNNVEEKPVEAEVKKVEKEKKK